MMTNLCVERLFACDAFIGMPERMQYDFVPGLPDLERRFHRFPIEKALLRGLPGTYVPDPALANEVVAEAIRFSEIYQGIWQVTPDDPEPHLKEMKKAGMKCVWLKNDNPYMKYPLSPWCCGSLYELLQGGRIPLFLTWNSTDPGELDEALTSFPGLRVILLNVPRLGRMPVTEALLSRHESLHLCFCPAFSAHGAYLSLCNRYGSHRFVWGTNYPDAEEGAAVTGLFYAGLKQEALEAVAHGNMERLLDEVKP